MNNYTICTRQQGCTCTIQSEAEGLDQKMKMQQQELEQKLKELESFRLSFQEEHEKCMQAESALLS